MSLIRACLEAGQLYIHRSGRTARAGQEGFAVMLVSPGEQALYKTICATLKLPRLSPASPGWDLGSPFSPPVAFLGAPDGVPALAIDASYMPGIRKRVSLAHQIEKLQEQTQKAENLHCHRCARAVLRIASGFSPPIEGPCYSPRSLIWWGWGWGAVQVMSKVNWFEKAAKEAELEVDDETMEEFSRSLDEHGQGLAPHQRMQRNRRDVTAQLERLKAELKELSKQPIVPRELSLKYPTAIPEVLAAVLRQGRQSVMEAEEEQRAQVRARRKRTRR
ncbi:hypothetical protein PAPYR_8557 [Paratrimastix pyriformis]|uniref:Uncharacterized protein n=1 Tax=Paratrimastix pyriformis TaxID=342808 RepID=A0ABQ8UAD4_9EUKA|nr:hypothetical protein PAPYR_8557 [Paratrimastix pyriformis]